MRRPRPTRTLADRLRPAPIRTPQAPAGIVPHVAIVGYGPGGAVPALCLFRRAATRPVARSRLHLGDGPGCRIQPALCRSRSRGPSGHHRVTARCRRPGDVHRQGPPGRRNRVVEMPPRGRPDRRVPADVPERDLRVAGRGGHPPRRRAVRPGGNLHGRRQRAVRGREDPGPGAGHHPRSVHGAEPTRGSAPSVGRRSRGPPQQAVGHPRVRRAPDGEPDADDPADAPGHGGHRGDRRRARARNPGTGSARHRRRDPEAVPGADLPHRPARGGVLYPSISFFSEALVCRTSRSAASD